MTLQMMCEIVRQQFPDKGDTQIKLDLNNAYRIYAQETRLPFEFVDVTATDDGSLEALGEQLEISGGWYRLPDAVIGVSGVTAYDKRNNEVSLLDYHIEWMGRIFAIFDYDNNLFTGAGFPSSVARLRFACSIEPENLSQDSDTPDIPEAFHQGLIDHVLSKYYGFKGILQQSGWFRSNYQATVQSGKRYFNRNTS